MRAITGQGAYANLALADALDQARLESRDSGLVTDVVAGTCRAMTTLDLVIEAASGRALKTLQPAVVDLLRLGSFELLFGRAPQHAVLSTYVELTRDTVGERATGVVNAILRRVSAKDEAGWLAQLDDGDAHHEMALATWHPSWIVDAYIDVLGVDEAQQALMANNEPPTTTLVIRPGLAERDELMAVGAQPGRWSPYAVTVSGDPSRLPQVRHGSVGVQDEGSQLVALALAKATAPNGDWLDLCAGPGGKTALLTGLLGGCGLAVDQHEHRAQLVRQAVGVFNQPPSVVVADATVPAWPAHQFARVLADVPCSGLGALRRRPDARWRRLPEDIDQLYELQVAILLAAVDAAMPGGVVAYATCSPHRRETVDVVTEVLTRRPGVELMDATTLLPEVPDCASPIDGQMVQLWPHRHGTDAMFLAMLQAHA